MSLKRIFHLHQQDNVAVAVDKLLAGNGLEGWAFNALNDVPVGHKIAIRDILRGEVVIKYGHTIGQTIQDIKCGEHVHEHNLGMLDFEREHKIGDEASPTEYFPEEECPTFNGYRRGDGKVGTRNYVGIISSVNCSATVTRQVVREIEKRGILERFPNVDGVVPITHQMGCCTSTKGEGFHMLQRTIWGHLRHPNFAAVMMVGLGCETNQIPKMIEAFGKPPEKSFFYKTIQGMGGSRKTVEALVEELENRVLPEADQARREPLPISELNIALQCGGSDGMSGITANPALGLAMDRLIRHGGSALLGETTEVYGAEHLLTGRAESNEVGQKLIDRIKWWEDYTSKLDGEINNNPTPGNKLGGLTTILEKSLGAVCKAGCTNMVDVLRYGEPMTKRGMMMVDTPGYDPMSITGQVACGSNLICFTTGRGSAYGNKPVPSIKIATNSIIYKFMEEDMDINAGTIIEGIESHEEVANQIFSMIIDVASGKQTSSELLGYGDNEFVPWNINAVV